MAAPNEDPNANRPPPEGGVDDLYEEFDDSDNIPSTHGDARTGEDVKKGLADALHSQCVGAFAITKKAANTPRRNSLTPCLSDSRCRTNNGNCLQVPCSSHFWSDVHPASR